jgi:bacterioferritin
MKGNSKLIATMNALLADELTAINQYMVHSEMCANWGYDRLHKKIEGRAIQEMKHAEKLISRIIFLEGKPTVSKLNDIHIGADVPKQFVNDLAAEMGAIRNYNEAIKLAAEVKDMTTFDVLTSILNDEDAHVDWIEEQQDQLKQMGEQVYLGMQIRE